MCDILLLCCFFFIENIQWFWNDRNNFIEIKMKSNFESVLYCIVTRSWHKLNRSQPWLIWPKMREDLSNSVGCWSQNHCEMLQFQAKRLCNFKCLMKPLQNHGRTTKSLTEPSWNLTAPHEIIVEPQKASQNLTEPLWNLTEPHNAAQNHCRTSKNFTKPVWNHCAIETIVT